MADLLEDGATLTAQDLDNLTQFGVDQGYYRLRGNFMKRFAFAVTLMAPILTACTVNTITHVERIPLSNAEIAKIKQATSYRLKDPDSAKFRGIRKVRNTYSDGSVVTLVCGQVNGKNSFGGYAGFNTFTGGFRGENFHLQGIGNKDTEFLYAARCGAA